MLVENKDESSKDADSDELPTLGGFEVFLSGRFWDVEAEVEGEISWGEGFEEES